MEKRSESNLRTIGILSGAVGVVAFLALLILGDYRIVPAFFLALLVAVIAAIFLMVGFNRKPGSLGREPARVAAAPGMPPHSVSGTAAKPARDGTAAVEPAARASTDPVDTAPASEPAKPLSSSPDTGGAATADVDVSPVSEPVEREAVPAPGPDLTARQTGAEGDVTPVPPMTQTAEPEVAPAPPAETGAAPVARPAALSAARAEGADDLKKIKGIGPKLEQLCNSLGIYHFDQIGGWSAAEVAWLDDNLQGFKGRVTRDSWVEQAGLLASGGETAFSKRVDGGSVH